MVAMMGLTGVTVTVIVLVLGPVRPSAASTSPKPWTCQGFPAVSSIDTVNVSVMMFALVVGAHHDVPPTHVEDRNQLAVFVVDGNLSLRSWEPRPDVEQPQPGLLRGLRPGIDQVEGNACPSNDSPPSVALRQHIDVGHLQFGRASERVDRHDGVIDWQPAGEVQRSSRRRRDGHATNDLNLVVLEAVGPRVDSTGRAAIPME
jgi:hypothetical protein